MKNLQKKKKEKKERRQKALNRERAKGLPGQMGMMVLKTIPQ